MKRKTKYLCISLIFLLLFTTAFVQQPTEFEGVDETQITEQQPSAVLKLELEVTLGLPVGAGGAIYMWGRN